MKNSKKGHIEIVEKAHRKQARITLCACAIVVLHYSFCGWQLYRCLQFRSLANCSYL